VLADRLRAGSVVFALVLPASLALLATRCATMQPAASPAPAAAPPAVPDASASGWAMPEIPLAKPGTIVLLRAPPAGPDASSITAIAPDPPALSERGQWVYDLGYVKGELFLRGVHRVELPAPRATPRVMGRFALELYSGPTLIERVRFDFPGLGAPEPAPPLAVAHHTEKGTDAGTWQPLHAATFSFTAKVTTRVGVMLPATSRGTRLSLWDRATDRRWPLPWPATEIREEAPAATDAGAGGS
jgi:hypothetical protein